MHWHILLAYQRVFHSVDVDVGVDVHHRTHVTVVASPEMPPYRGSMAKQVVCCFNSTRVRPHIDTESYLLLYAVLRALETRQHLILGHKYVPQVHSLWDTSTNIVRCYYTPTRLRSYTGTSEHWCTGE